MTAAALLCLLAGALVLVLQEAIQDERDHTATASPAAAASNAAGVGQGLARYSVFSRTDLAAPQASVNTRFQGKVPTAVGQSGFSEFKNVDPSMTRLAQVVGGKRLYLQAFAGLICSAVDLGEGVGPTGCAPANTAFDKLDLGTGVTFADDGFFVTGIAPDGTGSITLEHKTGRIESLELINNTIATSTSEPPVKLSWVDSIGTPHSYEFIDVSR